MPDEPETSISVQALLDGLAALPALAKRVEALEGEVAFLRKALLVKGGKRKWLKLAEAANELNTSTTSVRRMIERGFLRRNAASRHILIPVEDVENLAAKVIL